MNMKKTLLIIGCILATSQTFSQDRKGFIGIGFGSATPLGDFASTSGNYDKAGYASAGASFNFNFHYKLNEWGGLSISSIGAANGMAVDKAFPNAIGGVSVDKPSSASCFLIGGYLKKESFPLYGKIQIGYGSVKTAELSDATSTLKQSDATYGLAYGIGLGALFTLSDRWAITAAIDYIACNATPSGVYAVSKTTGAHSSGSTTFSYGQTYISSQIGIGYMFK